jgi:hypothetical protein
VSPTIWKVILKERFALASQISSVPFIFFALSAGYLILAAKFLIAFRATSFSSSFSRSQAFLNLAVRAILTADFPFVVDYYSFPHKDV